MNTFEYLMIDEPARTTNSFLTGSFTIPAPCFIPEIKGEEDIEVLLRFSKALDSHTPIIVPGYRWSAFISNPRFRFSDFDKINILDLVKNHPIIFYEPPEFFRYSLSKTFVTYCLKGDRQKARKFNKDLKMGNMANALSHIPEFFKPFVERQIGSIYKDNKINIPAEINRKNDVRNGWHDQRVEDSYATHMAEIINEALKMPSAVVIPTVPPILKNSERTIFERTFSTNVYTSLLCKKMSEEKRNPVRPYFHLNVDRSILASKNDQNFALNILENGLAGYEFCGIALTLAGYESTAIDGKFNKIEKFVTDIVNVSHSYRVPVLLPRSGWFGLSLVDQGIQAFGGLLNGQPKYIRGGGIGKEEDKYGKAPLIDDCKELNLTDVKQYIKKYGEFPKVPNLPSKPDSGDLSNPLKYRINFAKPMRLIHVEEARRLREGQLKEVINPARRYLERSKHQLLMNV